MKLRVNNKTLMAFVCVAVLGSFLFSTLGSSSAHVGSQKHHKLKKMSVVVGEGCVRVVGDSYYREEDVQVSKLPGYKALRGGVVKARFVDVVPEDGQGVVAPDTWTKTTNSKGWVRITFQFTPPSFNFRVDLTVSKKGFKKKRLSSPVGLYPVDSPADGCPPLPH